MTLYSFDSMIVSCLASSVASKSVIPRVVEAVWFESLFMSPRAMRGVGGGWFDTEDDLSLIGIPPRRRSELLVLERATPGRGRFDATFLLMIDSINLGAIPGRV